MSLGPDIPDNQPALEWLKRTGRAKGQKKLLVLREESEEEAPRRTWNVEWPIPPFVSEFFETIWERIGPST